MRDILLLFLSFLSYEIFSQCSLSFQFSPNDTICERQPTTISITNPGIGGTIVWSGGDLATPVNGLQISVAPNVSQSYIVNWNDGICNIQDTVRLVVTPVRAIIISQANPTCGQNTGRIIGAASGLSLVYTWYRNGVFFSDGASQITNVPDGNYTYVVFDNITGCSDTINNIVLTNSNSFPVFSSIQTTGVGCFGDTTGAISITASGGSGTYTYRWSHNSTLSSNTVRGLTSGVTYRVTLSDGVCPPIDSSIIISGPSDSVRVVLRTYPDNCKQGVGSARAIATGGVGSYNYDWSIGSAFNDSTHSITGPSSISITVTDGNNCSTVINDTILNTGSPTTSVLRVDSSCIGGTQGAISVLGTSLDGPFRYLWSHDTLLTASEALNLAPGAYTVSVFNNLNCAEILNVTVPSYSGGQLDLGPNQIILLGQTASFEINTDVNIKRLLWSPTQVGVDNFGTAYVSPNKTTIYSLTVEYGKGCYISDNITIFIDSSSQTIKIPDVFSPNGDGINDFFYIQQNGISDFEFAIFDRWGGIVYKTDNPDFKWDGTSSENILSSGNYLYSTRYKFFNKNEFESKKGYITLLK